MFHLFGLVALLAAASGQRTVRMLDTRGDFVMNKEGEVPALNDAVLMKDPKANLPSQFTICGTVFLANKVGVQRVWVQLVKEDMSPWFDIYTELKNAEKDTEEIVHKCWIVVNGAWYYLSDYGSLHYNRWVHMCVSLDLASGLISPVVDGHRIITHTTPDLGAGRPKSLAGRIFLGIYINGGGTRVQAPQRTGNLQIYGKALSEAQMKSITTSGTKCDAPGDYLSWDQVLLKTFSTCLSSFIPDGVGGAGPHSSVGQREPRGAVHKEHRGQVHQHRPGHASTEREVGVQ